MQSSIPLLKKLLNSPETQLSETVPAKKWLESKKKNIRKSLVPFAGDLTFPERAKIANWFEKHVADQDPKRRKEWLGLLPIAHAHTIYIASQLKVDCSGAAEEAGELLHGVKLMWIWDVWNASGDLTMGTIKPAGIHIQGYQITKITITVKVKTKVNSK